MRKQISRAGQIALTAVLPVTLALALDGCAWQAIESDHVNAGLAERHAAIDPDVRTTEAKANGKLAEAKKPKTVKAAANHSPPRPAAGLDEASCSSADNCASVLKAMVAGPDRSWIQRPAAPIVLASGVRLFAYRALRTTLTCGELSAAMTEVDMAVVSFSIPILGLGEEQIARLRTLCVEVGGELHAENARRCASGSKDSPVGFSPPSAPPATAQPG